MSEVLTLREATYADEGLLLKWANDCQVRNHAFHMETITEEEHHRWFLRIMQEPNVLQYILMKDGIPVGQVRLDCEAGNAEIDYSIAADFRGNGYGEELLRLIIWEVESHHPEIHRLIGKVKMGNTASERCFDKCRFKSKYTCYEYSVSKD